MPQALRIGRSIRETHAISNSYAWLDVCKHDSIHILRLLYLDCGEKSHEYYHVPSIPWNLSSFKSHAILFYNQLKIRRIEYGAPTRQGVSKRTGNKLIEVIRNLRREL